MGKKKPSKGIAKPASKKAAKKVAARSRTRSSGGRGAVETLGAASPIAVPKEWQGGRIVLAKPPAKPLKGREAERLPATAVRDTEGRSIPRKVSDWFVRKLDGLHKVLVRSFDHYEAPKEPYLSPEAAHVLQENAAAWAKLMEAEKADATKREQERLDSLTTTQTPKEFQNSKVVLAKPKKPVAEAHCWKPDFAGEIYPAVLHYYGYLPAEHVGSIRDPNGYPAKAMSPEAAKLYRTHRTFWEAKHAESKASSRTASAARKRTAKATIEKAATSAGLSQVELTAKLDRLGMLVEEGHLQLVADMIAGFRDTWLYEALLAGSAINPEGDLKPGKILKRFKDRATFVLVLALAAMPDGGTIDPSLRRDATIALDVTADTVDIVADIALRLPNLRVHWKHGAFDNLRELLPQTATVIATRALAGGELSLLNLTKINPEVAAALALHRGTLEVGLTDLSEPIATVLSRHCGDLELPNLKAISEKAAAALERHTGKLVLGDDQDEPRLFSQLMRAFPDRGDGHGTFNLDVEAARYLGQHSGPVSIRGVKRMDAQVALALSVQSHGLDLPDIAEFPAGLSGVRLCEALAKFPGGCRDFWLLSLSAECASALAESKGRLSVHVKTWSDEALSAIARHQGQLEINPASISDAVGAALSRRTASTSLKLSDLYEDQMFLSDGAAEALSSYQGGLSFEGKVEMSLAAATLLAQRATIVLYRSKLKPSIRRIFECAGTWKDVVWTRHARAGKTVFTRTSP